MQCFMNKMLHEHIPNVTMPFLDSRLIEGCFERGKYEIIDWNGCQSFVIYNTIDCECILKKIRYNWNSQENISIFHQNEVLIASHMCRW